jgi:ferritin-like metal-binding protein YciE
LGKDPKATTCDAMKGLVNEGESIIGDIDESPLRDAGLIAAANRIEHYEIAAYGSAKTFAQILSLTGAVTLLAQTLQEEKMADHKLTEIAQSMVNMEALRAGDMQPR